MGAEKKTNITIKVVLGYIFVFLAIISSLFIAYQSYNKLLGSVISLSKPDAEIARMNHILTDLSEAENQIRVYFITKKEKYLQSYVENILDIQSELDSLRHFTPDSNISHVLIDSMSFLLAERTNKLEAFVRLKRSKEKENLSEQAIQQLSEASDSARTKIKTTTTTLTYLDTVVTTTEEKEKKQSFINRLLKGKKAEKEVDSLKTIIKRTEVKVDTSYLPQSDSLLRNFENMFQLAQAKEQLNREIVSRQELQLVEENSLIWDKIKLLLSQLEKERMQQLYEESNSAKQIASNSIFIIAIIIIVGFVLGVLFVIFILMDLSKSNYYRKELLVAKAKAEKLANVKEEFLATMSHEIRTPLNAIIGFTNQLNKTSLANHQQSFVKILRNSSNHLLGLVNEILDLSKIEAGKLHVETIGFKPHDLVGNVFEILRVNAANKNIEFLWEFHGNESIVLGSDPFRIKQILLNLGSNAIKFTPNGTVKLKASLTKNNEEYLFKVRVEDTGIGIEEDKLEHIFEDFSQADSFSARKYGGTGLGLSISRKLARLLGGDLHVESELGIGSCFSFQIVLKETELQKEELNTNLNSKTENFALKKFLVADDDEYSLLLLQSIFSAWKVDCDFVDNGAKAWKLFEANKYHMLLTDIHMPEMGGIELCRKIRTLNDQEKANIPIVALTANVRESDLKKYLDSGMTECLVKPFDEEVLQSMLLNLLNGTKPVKKIKPMTETGSKTKEQVFDLSQVRKFTADDTELLRQVLNQFIVSAEENVQAMNQAFLQQNHLKVGEIAHKMLSSFNQLNVVRAVPFLKELEDLLHKKTEQLHSADKIENLVNRVSEHTKSVVEAIRKEMKSL